MIPGIHVAQISALIVLAMPSPAVSQDAGIARGTVVQGRFLSFVGRTDERSVPINWYSGDLSTPLLHNINVLMPDYAKYLANMPTFGGGGAVTRPGSATDAEEYLKRIRESVKPRPNSP